MDFLHDILGPDLNKAFFTILNIIFVEGLLSVDNAAVLATLVMDLPENQRARALRIGLIFAYIFRGAALLLAGYLLQINWVKLVGGAYLLFLALKFFYEKLVKHKGVMDEAKEEIEEHVPKKRLFGLNQFWSTVIMVESMDLVFSLDNVLAAGAFSNNMYIICTGVFIGIITMRIVASYFVKLMQRFPFLDFAAFIVIAMLGCKLIFEYFFPIDHAAQHAKGSGIEDYLFSIGTIGIFLIPIITSLLFNFPKNNKVIK